MYEEHEEESGLDDASFISKAKSEIPMTPRSVPQPEDLGLFSPGTFFSEKSGRMGQLGGSAKVEERVCYQYVPISLSRNT
jgi:hypothetical protein